MKTFSEFIYEEMNIEKLKKLELELKNTSNEEQYDKIKREISIFKEKLSKKKL